MRFSVQGDYVFDRVLASKEKALSMKNDILSGARDAEDVVPYGFVRLLIF